MIDIKRVNQKVVAALPSIMQRANRYAPKLIQKQLLSLALNQFFQQECRSGQLNFLAGKCLVIEVTDYQLSFGISLHQQRLRITMPTEPTILSEPTVNQLHYNSLIKAGSKDFLQMMTNKVDPDTLFFRRKLVMLGDTELSLQCKNLLDSIGLDRLPKPILQSLNWLVAQQTS